MRACTRAKGRDGVRTVAPEGPDLVLTTHIPDGEGDVLVLDRLDVETCSVSTPCNTARAFHVPIVGIVVTISPSLSLYRMVVLPAASSPTIRMPARVSPPQLRPTRRYVRISFLPKRPESNRDTDSPISNRTRGSADPSLRALSQLCKPRELLSRPALCVANQPY